MTSLFCSEMRAWDVEVIIPVSHPSSKPRRNHAENLHCASDLVDLWYKQFQRHRSPIRDSRYCKL